MIFQKLMQRAESARMLQRLGVGSRAEVPPRARRALLGGAAERLRATRIGNRLASYAEKAHPSLPFSDVVALLLASAVAGGLAGRALFGGSALAFAGALAGPVALDRFGVRIGVRRTLRLEQQLPDALALQAAALRAGHSIVRSLRVVAGESRPPLRDEVSLTLGDIDIGRSLDESIRRMTKRMPSRDFGLWVTAMQVQRVTGGDLSKVLESLASQIRDRAHMRAEVRALTAQARLSGMVVALAPAAFFLLLSVTARQQMRILYTTPLGLLLLALGISMQVAGFVGIRWILRVKP